MAVTVVPDFELSFSVPVVTPKIYITKGPSGWPETFKRAELDKELAEYIKPCPVDDFVDLFCTERDLREPKTPTDWHTVVGFIGRTISISPLAVPHRVAIAFWGQIVLAAHSRGAN